MGLTAKWRVKCVSLVEAKDILARCKRLEQENRRWEHQYFQERLASLHQPSGLSVTAAPFQPRAAMLMPRPAEMASDQHEAEKRGSKAGLTPSRSLTTSSVGKVPSPIRGPYPQTSDDDATSDVGLVDPSSHKKEGAGATEVVKVVKAQIALTPPDPLLLAEVEGKRKMDFLAKSRSQSLVGERGI